MAEVMRDITCFDALTADVSEAHACAGAVLIDGLDPAVPEPQKEFFPF
jgi:hypothetical protein